MKSREQRQRLAMEAARLMANEGIADAGWARRKAARRLGISDRGSQPDDEEVLQQLRDYQWLFGPALPGQALRRMRLAALQAMEFFERFQPRLAGSVLDGSAHAHSPVLLHLHADDPESLPRFLLEAAIPAESGFRRLRGHDAEKRDYPLWSFVADGQAFELLLLPLSALRQAPLGSNGRPQRRINRAGLQALVEGRDGDVDADCTAG